MGNPVVHFEVYGKDAKKLSNFYSKAFGWKIEHMPQMNYGMVDTASGGKGINGGIAQPMPGGKMSVTFYVEVDDLGAKLKEIEKMGGKTVMPVTTVPNMVTFALFSDPEGNVIGLVKSEQPRG